VIIAWILSIVFSFSSLILYLERMNVLELIHIHTQSQMQESFVQAEQMILDCQTDLLLGMDEHHPNCDFHSPQKNYWLISNLEKPQIEVLILVDLQQGVLTRLNWRQVFD